MADRYENPLCRRYCGEKMQFLFSDDNKFRTWRKLWIILAESQKELGLAVTDEQISEMKIHADDINYDAARQKEAEVRHDVMAHILAFGEQCPVAKPIIHLGATSCYVGDNTDIIIQKSALLLIKETLLGLVAELHDFCDKYKALPTLGYTHFQAAQPTTVGKRASLWLQDLVFDLEHLDFVLDSLKLLGCRGTTGTGASFLALFEGDEGKVTRLEKIIAEKLGFDGVYSVSGQTYSRKIDYYILSVLSGIAQSAHKFSNDIRLLSHLKEVDEPFEKGQIGSSAMPYKRNPMRSERMASLARHLMVTVQNTALTASEQWLERTLDDSANRRISIPEAFLAADGILRLYINIIRGLTVYPKMIEKHLNDELPFMATENILMHCVKAGGDRQKLHERIRIHSVEAARRVKEGGTNDLISMILSDEAFNLTESELQKIMSADNFTGMAMRQTEEFLKEVRAIISGNKAVRDIDANITV